MAELVDQALRAFGLLHDSFLVILSNGAAELVVIHGRPVLALAPKPCDPDGILDFEHSLGAV